MANGLIVIILTSEFLIMVIVTAIVTITAATDIAIIIRVVR